MKAWVKYILLDVAMLMYAGCSNHPPSAASFMEKDVATLLDVPAPKKK